jgi:hypothetical protein
MYIALAIVACWSCTKIKTKDFFVSVDDYKIYVEESGKGEPVIFFTEDFLTTGCGANRSTT